jgi:tetratricopeptide (TPR) repeat protein
MKSSSPSNLVLSFQALVQQGRLDDLERVAHLLESQVQNINDWQTLLEAFRTIPNEHLFARPLLAVVFARAHAGARAIPELIDFCDHALERLTGAQAAPIWVRYAWALQRTGRDAESLVALERAMPFLEPAELGFAWKLIGFARHRLNLPDWEEAFMQARAHLRERTLGLALLDHGMCLDADGQTERARDCWLEALPMLARDAHHLAWARFNLGVSSLRDGLHDAERHFIESERQARRSQSHGMTSRALAGLGSVRRFRGEWDRAISAYQRAIRAAKEPEDAHYARRHLALTYRLANRASEALEVLYQALHAQPTEPEHSALHAQLGATRLVMGDLAAARQALEHAGTPEGNEAMRCQIYRAELARRSGQPKPALEQLEGIVFESPTAQEEFAFWSDLAAFATLAGLPVTTRDQAPARNHVRVEALGALQATVNGQPVPLEGRTAELVVFLLEHTGVLPLEMVADAIWPECDRKRGEWNVKSTARRVRESLGWSSCISVSKGRVQLEARTIWEYDLNEFRANPTWPVPAFVPGIFSEWALEVAAGLEDLLEPRTLN